MKKILLSLISVLLINNSLISNESNIEIEDITYDWLLLANESAPTDYVPIFKKIFKQMKVKTLLEFGVSFSTKYFLDSCRKVISTEMITHGYGPDNFKKFLNTYQDYSNWIPLAYFSGYLGDPSWAPYKHLGSESVYKAASYQTATHKNYALLDDFYVMELNAFIKNLVRFHSIDVAFVNPTGVYLRGDLVQLLFGKVPVIVAHDTAFRNTNEHSDIKDDLLGYLRVVVPEDYEEIYFPTGGGTSVWIIKNDDKKELIQSLKKYAQEI